MNIAETVSMVTLVLVGLGMLGGIVMILTRLAQASGRTLNSLESVAKRLDNINGTITDHSTRIAHIEGRTGVQEHLGAGS